MRFSRSVITIMTSIVLIFWFVIVSGNTATQTKESKEPTEKIDEVLVFEHESDLICRYRRQVNTEVKEGTFGIKISKKGDKLECTLLTQDQAKQDFSFFFDFKKKGPNTFCKEILGIENPPKMTFSEILIKLHDHLRNKDLLGQDKRRITIRRAVRGTEPTTPKPEPVFLLSLKGKISYFPTPPTENDKKIIDGLVQKNSELQEKKDYLLFFQGDTLSDSVFLDRGSAPPPQENRRAFDTGLDILLGLGLGLVLALGAVYMTVKAVKLPSFAVNNTEPSRSTGATGTESHGPSEPAPDTEPTGASGFDAASIMRQELHELVSKFNVLLTEGLPPLNNYLNSIKNMDQLNIPNIGTEFSSLKEELAEQRRMIGGLPKKVDDVDNRVIGAADKVDAVNGTLATLIKDWEQTGIDLKTLISNKIANLTIPDPSPALNSLKETLAAQQRTLDGLPSRMDDVDKSLTGATKKVDSVNSQLNTLTSSLKDIATEMTTSASAMATLLDRTNPERKKVLYEDEEQKKYQQAEVLGEKISTWVQLLQQTLPRLTEFKELDKPINAFMDNFQADRLGRFTTHCLWAAQGVKPETPIFEFDPELTGLLLFCVSPALVLVSRLSAYKLRTGQDLPNEIFGSVNYLDLQLHEIINVLRQPPFLVEPEPPNITLLQPLPESDKDHFNRRVLKNREESIPFLPMGQHPTGWTQMVVLDIESWGFKRQGTLLETKKPWIVVG